VGLNFGFKFQTAKKFPPRSLRPSFALSWLSIGKGAGNAGREGSPMLKKMVGLSMLLAAVLQHAQAGAGTGQRDPRFAPGQMWSIKSAPQAAAKVIIDRIEPWRDKVVVHVSVVDVPIPRGMPGSGGTTAIGHLPFEQSAFAASVDRLLATGIAPASSFESGYKQWQDAKGGIFTVTIQEAIEFTFQAINRR
jgi:hypothetical protein